MNVFCLPISKYLDLGKDPEHGYYMAVHTFGYSNSFPLSKREAETLRDLLTELLAEQEREK